MILRGCASPVSGVVALCPALRGHGLLTQSLLPVIVTVEGF